MNEIAEYEKQFSSLVPEFNFYWNSENCNFNHGAESTVHGVFIAFSNIVCKKLEANSLENRSAIFAFIENSFPNKALMMARSMFAKRMREQALKYD